MAVKPLDAAFCTACVTLAGIDYALVMTSPGDLRSAWVVPVLLATVGAANLAGLVTAVINLILGHRPRIRRKR